VNDEIIHCFVGTNGREYCISLDRSPGGNYRIHERAKDSIGEPCWVQRICTQPQTNPSHIDTEKGALHEAITALHRLARECGELRP